MEIQKEMRALTGLRGVAALYVLQFHYIVGVRYTNPINTLQAHGYLAVDLFFVLSGLVMALNYRHLFERGFSKGAFSKFLGRRVARVYPLYLVGSLAALALILSGHLEWPYRGALWKTALANLAMVQSWGLTQSLDAPAWSISAEWAAYLVFPFLLNITLFRGRLTSWITGISAAATLTLLVSISSKFVVHRNPALLDLSQPIYGLPVIRCISEFTLGLLTARVLGTACYQWVREHTWFSVATTVATIAFLMVPRGDLVVVFLSPFLLISLIPEGSLPNRVLASPLIHLLGLLSYSIYITHALFAAALPYLKRLAVVHGVHHAQTVAGAMTLVLTVLGSYLTYHYVEVPGREWLRTILETRREASIIREKDFSSPLSSTEAL